MEKMKLTVELINDNEEHSSVTIERESYDFLTWKKILEAAMDACAGHGYCIADKKVDEIRKAIGLEY